ncbi:hypothetical protein PF008_g19020 [Phytophthora fragariae]|uniref:Uncharacterized protein n=1 Tax=Phytophthora fragariae TaxID=53985 RepID=A0A6G0R4Q5_9STRA|nr:hypothetical protein PF008_g19020 [Phytophthora fragariae]
MPRRRRGGQATDQACARLASTGGDGGRRWKQRGTHAGPGWSAQGEVPVVETRGRVNGETELPVLGKRRRGDEVVMKADGELIAAKAGGELIDVRASVESTGAKLDGGSTGAKTDGESKSAAVDMELGTVYVSAEVTEDVR